MVFATSDLHGFPLKAFQKFLHKVNFCEDDYLFVLGDVIDRNGDGGVELLRWMMSQSNVELILGNHEAMLLACTFLFQEVTDKSIDSLTIDQIGALSNWINNGAQPTLNALNEMQHSKPELVTEIIEYLQEAPLYDTVFVGNNDFLLVHSGLGNFSSEKDLHEYSASELLWCRPHTEQKYFKSVMTVFGHTPTSYYGYSGRAYRTDTWIDIDTGAASGGSPMLLRLDDLHEFYYN